jgi:hypothetical protein
MTCSQTWRRLQLKRCKKLSRIPPVALIAYNAEFESWQQVCRSRAKGVHGLRPTVRSVREWCDMEEVQAFEGFPWLFITPARRYWQAAQVTHIPEKVESGPMSVEPGPLYQIRQGPLPN